MAVIKCNRCRHRHDEARGCLTPEQLQEREAAREERARSDAEWAVTVRRNDIEFEIDAAAAEVGFVPNEQQRAFLANLLARLIP